jgi:glycosyltransferase involved in cell wall biosynthesis
MAAGKIIITTNVGSIPNLITDGYNGFLISPGDIASLVDRIHYITLHPEKFEKVSENNVHKVENLYSIRHFNKHLYHIYHQILE